MLYLGAISGLVEVAKNHFVLGVIRLLLLLLLLWLLLLLLEAGRGSEILLLLLWAAVTARVAELLPVWRLRRKIGVVRRRTGVTVVGVSKFVHAVSEPATKKGPIFTTTFVVLSR